MSQKSTRQTKGPVTSGPLGGIRVLDLGRVIAAPYASSTAETADYTAISVGYSNTQGHFILHAGRGHLEFGTLKLKALQLHRRWPQATFIVEAAMAGLPLIQELRALGLTALASIPRESKEHRAYLVLK